MRPLEYIGKNWDTFTSNLSTNELRFEASTMITLRKDCSRQARDDLSRYTGAIASILNVKQNLVGCEAPVLDRDGWIGSLKQNPTNEQLQKWIFAWMYVRSNYNKMCSTLKHPDEIFEDKFLASHGLKYDKDGLSSMKKNSKTCVRLLYSLRARTWKESMMADIKQKLGIIISVTAPRHVRDKDPNYRRDPKTFFLGKIIDGKKYWTEVSHCLSDCLAYIYLFLVESL